MQVISSIVSILGALALFLFGMALMSEGLQKAAGDKLRALLAAMTSNPFKRVLTGLLVTAIIQSSSATTVMVVSFVNAGLLSLTNAIGVIMGANIGTTVTAWLISLLGFSFNISTLSIPLVAVGFVFMMSRRMKYKNIGQLIIGFALLFLGLSYLKNSVPDLSSHPQTLAFLQNITQYGFGSVLLFLLVGTLLTIILQSSSATMALTLVMVNFGWIPFEMAAAMVLGENIGTTITANIAAAVGNTSAKRAALAHTVFNLFGVVWMLVFFHPFLKLVGLVVSSFGVPNPILTDFTAGGGSEAIHNSALYGVSMLHTMFNVCNTLIMIWFVPIIVRVVTFVIKSPETEETYSLQYISGGPLSTAELSLNEATNEISNFAQICYKDFGHIRSAINEKDPSKFMDLNDKLVRYEEITDKIEGEIAAYLSEVSKGELSVKSGRKIKSMYKIIGELESLGDSGEAIGRILRRKNEHNKEFDDQMLEKLNHMLDTVEKAYKVMMDNLKVPYESFNDLTAACDAEDAINECRNTLREEHIANLENSDYNYRTGVYYMDVVSELERIGDFIINVSQAEQAVK